MKQTLGHRESATTQRYEVEVERGRTAADFRMQGSGMFFLGLIVGALLTLALSHWVAVAGGVFGVVMACVEYSGKKPRKPLRRHTRLSSGGRPRAKNNARRTKEWLRAYGSEERVEWIKSLPCVVCLRRPSENMHVRGGGMARKADARWVIPACSECHHEAHRSGIRTLAARCGVDLERYAAMIEERWQAHTRRSA